VSAKDDQPQVQVLLVFGNDGQLRQRKAVLVQKNTDGTQATQMVWQQTLGDDGAVTVSNCTKNPPQTDKYELRIGRGPSMSVDESLVVVPMPIRSADFLRKRPDGVNQARAKWSDDLTMQWMMANLDGDWTQVRDAAAEYIRKDDHRIGLFVLMSSCQGNWTATSGAGTGREGLEFDPQKHFPNSSLAALIAGQAQMRTSGNYKEVPVVGSEVGGFTGNLTEMFNLVYLWTQSKAGRDATFTRRDGNRLVNFVTSSGWMEGNTAALMLPQYYVGGNWFNDMVGQNTAALVDTTDLSAYSRLQIAQAIAGKDTPAAARMYVRLFNEALERGGVPYVDNGFRNAVATAEQAKVNDFPAGTWTNLMKKATKTLADRGDRLGLLVLMRQCWSFGDTAMAEEMFEQALAGADEPERGMVQLTAVQMLYHVGQYDRAWIIVQDMLRDKKWGEDPSLLRIGSTLASNRGRLAQSLRYLEKAMEIEYRQLPEVINLEVVRRDYSELLGRYQQVAVALATLDDEPSQDLMSRVVRAADRWRMLDSDDQAASMAASKTLQTLGAQDLAWDYLTTPLAMKPNEAQPWLGMAQNLRNEQQYDLAGRAYASAFAAEGSNAQILWDWAQMLQQAGKTVQAREVYRKIADGDWQPKFNYLKEQAKRQTGR
jgi:tetratricopeptide (TPR) repeat protein